MVGVHYLSKHFSEHLSKHFSKHKCFSSTLGSVVTPGVPSDLGIFGSVNHFVLFNKSNVSITERLRQCGRFPTGLLRNKVSSGLK